MVVKEKKRKKKKKNVTISRGRCVYIFVRVDRDCGRVRLNHHHTTDNLGPYWMVVVFLYSYSFFFFSPLMYVHLIHVY